MKNLQEIKLRLLRYIIDFNGNADTSYVKKLSALNITGTYLADKDAHTGKISDNEYSLLFDFCMDYFSLYNYLPTNTAIGLELAEASELDPFTKRSVLEVLDAVSGYPVVEGEFQYILDQILAEYKRNSMLSIIHKSIDSIDEGSIDDSLNYIQKNLAELQAVTDKRDIDRMPKYIWQVAEQYLSKLDSGESLIGAAIPYGFQDLDMILGGIYQGELSVLVGGMNVGKSFVGGAVGYTNVFEYGNKVVFANLEMDEEQVMVRLLSRQTGIPSRRIRRETFSSSEREILKAALEDLSDRQKNNNLVLFDINHCLTPAILERNIDLKFGDDWPDLIILDYIDEMLPNRSTGQKWSDLDSVIHDLKHMCLRHKTRILSMTQLNAKGIQNINADMTNVSYKSIAKVADTMLLLLEDPDMPYIGPGPNETVGTPGHIIVKVLRARNDAKNISTKLLVEFATTSIQQSHNLTQTNVGNMIRDF